MVTGLLVFYGQVVSSMRPVCILAARVLHKNCGCLEHIAPIAKVALVSGAGPEEKPMKLYNNDLSPFSARCRLMLYAKGIEVEMVDPFSDANVEAFKALTPLGKVPTLETDDGWVLPESETICEYLEQLYPNPSLLPDDPKERARVRLLGRIGDLYLLQPLTVLFGNIDPSVRDHDKVVTAFGEMKTAIGWLDHYLDGDSYAVGGKLSLADCALVPIFFFVRRIPELFGKSGCLLDMHQNATSYWRGIFDEPAVVRVHDEMDRAMKGTR